MQTTVTKAGNAPDLLSGILSVQVRNEDKITEQDRLYCQNQQDELYKTLDQIAWWYNIFKREAEKYEGKIKLKHEPNGKITTSSYDLHYRYNNDEKDYTHHEFTPFKNINELVDSRHNAIRNFISRIIGYFNNTYSVSVEAPKIDEKTLPIDFRPVYNTYVDVVIEHLGGKSFRETAVEELLARVARVVKPSCWSKVKTELKKDRIVFPEIIRFDDYYIQYNNRCKISYNYGGELETLCAGIAYGADDILNGNSKMIIRFDDNDVSVTDWYDLTTTNAEQIRFYKNGRIDVRFKDSAAAGNCFKRLRLDEITQREN
jgi:hypothetical protein